MNCEQFDRRLDQLLDHRERVECDAEVVTHALLCHQCHHTLEAHRAWMIALDQEVLEAPPGDAVKAIVRESRSEGHAPPSSGVVPQTRPGRRRRGVLAARRRIVAAALLLVLAVGLPRSLHDSVSTKPDNLGRDRVSAAASPTREPGPQVAAAGAFADLTREVGSHVADLREETRISMSDVVLLLPLGETPPEVEVRVEVAAASDHWAAPLRCLTDSALAGFQSLWEVVPDGPDDDEQSL